MAVQAFCRCSGYLGGEGAGCLSTRRAFPLAAGLSGTLKDALTASRFLIESYRECRRPHSLNQATAAC